ncbi:MAG: hypothetical protein QN141_03675 [Armatimonadota bacterium]|nr:hypothetical protein [Armatimonadota bacterium]MDR7498115.1 hypothetical protein [Armatimonadota bacterium]MDR7557566.1 hypothetical protein [Armatimonadota bacterium]
MRRRYLYAGIGVILVAAALALPGLAQPGPGGRGGWGGWGMMGPGWGAGGAAVASLDDAAARARDALAAYGNADLVVEEVMEFSNHFYVLVKEKSTGLGAFELIVERNGFVHPEPGPNMMWNTKYGHMAGPAGWGMGPGMMGGGMMGGWGPGYGRGPAFQAPPPQTAPLAIERARQIAARYLAQTFPGTSPDEGTAFYGYFTFDVERGGTPVGMLSVNAYTGQVWYHAWHGAFVREKHF